MVDEHDTGRARIPVDADADERELIAAWHASGDGSSEAPPPLLNARILRAAREAVRDEGAAPAPVDAAAEAGADHSHGTSTWRWATAASLALAATLVLLMPAGLREPEPWMQSAPATPRASRPAPAEVTDQSTQVEEIIVTGARRFANADAEATAAEAAEPTAAAVADSASTQIDARAAGASNDLEGRLLNADDLPAEAVRARTEKPMRADAAAPPAPTAVMSAPPPPVLAGSGAIGNQAADGGGAEVTEESVQLEEIIVTGARSFANADAEATLPEGGESTAAAYADSAPAQIEASEADASAVLEARLLDADDVAAGAPGARTEKSIRTDAAALPAPTADISAPPPPPPAVSGVVGNQAAVRESLSARRVLTTPSATVAVAETVSGRLERGEDGGWRLRSDARVFDLDFRDQAPPTWLAPNLRVRVVLESTASTTDGRHRVLGIDPEN